ncbi:MAG: glycosyltransferase family 39 protein [Alphaproteobacteria bacterium]|nr:glycosyltransferase family 39 protein [Alphaproteobacteria bacterium]
MTKAATRPELRAPAEWLAGWPPAIAVVAILTAFRLLWLAGGPIDLYGDEAQYWIWAKEPAFGYYSKPPLVAWLIAASTAILGDGAVAIKLPSALVHAATALVLFAIGRDLGGRAVAFWSAVVWATLPAVTLSALIISTDPPLLLCWALALHAFQRARRAPGFGWWLACGLWVGLGLLAKYAMGYFLLSAALYLLATPSDRPLLWRRLPATLAVAAALLAPNIAWNVANGFATIRHTGDNANLGGTLFNPGALAEFLASQFLVFGPIPFLALLAALATGGDADGRRLGFFVWPTLVVACVIALLSRAHANWAAPAYVAATPLAVAWLVGRGRGRLVEVAVALHVALAVVVMLGPAAVRAAGWELPARYDPWRRVSGWAALGEEVGALRRRHRDAGLLVDSRLLLCSLVYYVRPHPFDVVKWNPDGVANDHFELTTHLEQAPHARFLLVTARPDPSEILARFASAERLAEIVVPLGPDRDRRHYVFLVAGFRGYH